jgi:2-C-methyl-D-erythritol 4-phosphate cytidylyltransferase
MKDAIYGIPIPFTVLQGRERIEGLLERDTLVNVQLPQKFGRERLLTCHERAIADGITFTEDASLLFHYTRAEIGILEGSDYNLKITSGPDFCLGERIYEEYITGRKSE